MKRNGRSGSRLLCAALGPAALAGCAQLNDPFKDAGAYARPELTTPSTDVYLAEHAHPPPMTGRTWEAADVYHENGAVTHWPLWFSDPFEDKGNELTDPNHRDAPDAHFAWNAVDYLHVGYGPGWFLLNLAGLPVSAVVQPPGMLMASNGRIDRGLLFYDHDARPARPTEEPPDFNDLSRARIHYREHGGPTHPERTGG